MKTDVLDRAVTRPRVLDYIELMKPELTGLSTLTTVCGYYLASSGGFDVARFFHVSIGTLLVGGGAGALNQYVEREYDALLDRLDARAHEALEDAPDLLDALLEFDGVRRGLLRHFK